MQAMVGELAVSAVESLAVLRSGDRVGAMLFDTRTELLSAPTADMRQAAAALEGALREGGLNGGTDINGAVLDAARYLRLQPKSQARRSILILTDNRSIKSKRDATVIRELWEADAVLNALIFETGLERAARRYSEIVQPWFLLLDANVKRIVEQTGGESLQAGDAPEAFREMLDRIRKRYSLHYEPPAGPPGKARSIRVVLTGEALARYPGAAVLARRGYLAAGSAP